MKEILWIRLVGHPIVMLWYATITTNIILDAVIYSDA